MKIREINIEQIKSQDSIYKQSSWSGIYSGELKTFGLFNKNDELIGDFLLQEVSMKGNRGFINPIFVSNNCLEVKFPSEKVSSRNAFEKRVMEAFAAFIESRKERIIDFSFPSEFTDTRPLVWQGLKIKPQYTYKLNLQESDTVLYKNLSSTTRANIRNAEADGLVVTQNANSEDFLDLIDKTFERQDEKYHRDILYHAVNSDELESKRRVFITHEGDKQLATVLIVFDDHFAYYIIGGYDHTQKHRGAMTLAMWKAIQFSKEKGINLFDFQGSMIPEVEKFFRGFGGQLHTYFRVSKISRGLKFGAKLLGKELGG